MGPKSKACVACRVAKRTCIHNDHPPCKRCKDRGDECFFPPPGTSSQHRQPRGLRPGRQRIDIKEQSTSPNAEGTSVGGGEGQGGRGGIGGGGGSSSGRGEGSADMSRRDPFTLFTDEVKNSYLRCSYKWCFHHIPTLLDKVRKGSLEQSLIWAILALAIRYVWTTRLAELRLEWGCETDWAILGSRVILLHRLRPLSKRVMLLLRMRDRLLCRIWNNLLSAEYKRYS
jgi:hypothetical protein